MLNQTSIHRLPTEIVIEIRRRLRARSSTQIEITSWLNKLGHGISNSALNRYALKLYKEDNERSIDREVLAQHGADVIALFEELADIKNRETEILAQIQTAVINKSQD